MTPRRVVVTGLGVVVPGGVGKEQFWKTILAGKTTIQRITRFDPSGLPTQIAAEAREFNPEDFIDFKKARRTDRCTQFALAAAKMATEDAKLNFTQEDPTRVGVGMGTSIGAQSWLFDQYELTKNRNFRKINPLTIAEAIPNALSSEISSEYGLMGPSETYSTGCSSSAAAIGHGFEQIRDGKLDIVLAGGAEAVLTYPLFVGFCAARIMSVHNEEPVGFPCPFDKRRDGIVLGEGGGVIVLEERNHALRRGIPIYGEILGWGATCDAYHVVNIHPEGKLLAKAIEVALQNADVTPEEVDYFNAHGSGTPSGDLAETRVIKQVFGEHAFRMGVSTVKPIFGYLNGAGKVVDVVACLLAFQHNILPPTIHYREEDPECDLDYVPNEPRTARLNVAVTTVYGFGGKNFAIVLRRGG